MVHTYIHTYKGLINVMYTSMWLTFVSHALFVQFLTESAHFTYMYLHAYVHCTALVFNFFLCRQM